MEFDLGVADSGTAIDNSDDILKLSANRVRYPVSNDLPGFNRCTAINFLG